MGGEAKRMAQELHWPAPLPLSYKEAELSSEKRVKSQSKHPASDMVHRSGRCESNAQRKLDLS